MPILLLRGDSSISLSTLVEKAQKKSMPLLEYDLQLNNNQLDLVLITKLERKVHPTSSDEGFESDIDSLSLVSSDNDSFTTEKLVPDGSKTTETDSAHGSSSSDSDTEIVDTKTSEIVLSTSTGNLTPTLSQIKESYNLVDCVCYTDVKSTDILIFVIRSEAFVFKFKNIGHLKSFYATFTSLKAVANQKAYNHNFASKFNLLQRTDKNGITHIEVARDADRSRDNGPSSIISINTPGEIFQAISKNNPREANSRQRTESQFINDIKYNTINSKLGLKSKIMTKSSSIENILDLDQNKSNLVNKNHLRKIWNSAEDLLDEPKRPERRKKGRAPQPPVYVKKQDILSGQYVRVNVNFDPVKDLDRNRMIIKSSMNEPHPRKLQNFNILSTTPTFTSFLKSKENKQVLKYEPRKIDTSTLNKTKLSSESSWTNSVPRLLKPRSKSETRNFSPMAYRYIDTTQEYPLTYSTNNQSNLVGNGPFGFGKNLALSNYLKGENQNINNRLFGMSPKLRNLPSMEDDIKGNKWKGSQMNLIKDNNLKSVIKNGKEETSKKKNDKKVTFSAYTTVQVV